MSEPNRVKSLFETDPIILKPTRLGLYPRIWNYFGYLPDLGTSYGTYKCTNDEHAGVICSDFEEPHCPQCGMSMESSKMELEVGDYDKIYTHSDAFNIVPKCSGCGVEILSNVDVVGGKAPTFHCVNCGKDIKQEYLKYVDMFNTQPITRHKLRDYVNKFNTNSKSEVTTMAKKTAATYEVLSYNNLPKTITADRLHMRCYAMNTDNPYWNVDIDGLPVGRIYLKDQVQHAELKHQFVTDYYANAIASAMESAGVVPTLKKVNARIWRAKVEESEFHKKVKAEVTERLEADYAERVENLKVKANNLKHELLECVALVMAGVNKNFFKDIGSPLKYSLYETMARYGISEENRTSIIESSFHEKEMEHFATIMDKAISFIDMNEEALAQLGKALADAETMDIESAEEDMEEAGNQGLTDKIGEYPLPDVMSSDMGQHMAKSSVGFTSIASVSHQPVSVQAKKEAFKKTLNFTYKNN